MKTVCIKCGEVCLPIEVDEGNYEEFWGAKVWRSVYEWYSDCCNAEVEEVPDDDDED